MMNLNGRSVIRVLARELTRLPQALRRPQPSEWRTANRPGHTVDSFLEGPCFDAAGKPYVVDIPHGRRRAPGHDAVKRTES